MIGSNKGFGRSHAKHYVLVIFTVVTVFLLWAEQLLAIGASGLYVTRIKMEYQYSDYGKFQYPLIESDDVLRGYEYLNPYLIDFPEHRFLSRIMQAVGPRNVIDFRHEYSDLNLEKNSQRMFLRFDRIINQELTLFTSGQILDINNTSPDSSSNSGGYAFGVGLKYDRSGWIKGETSISFDQIRTPERMIIKTLSPMINARYALNGKTAIGLRWEGYFTESDSGNYPANAVTLILSRYLPTNTGMHIYTRMYKNDYGITSFSPAIELAQYILWNLSIRLNYRYYDNSYNENIAPQFLQDGSITATGIRLSCDWYALSTLKISTTYRRYMSDQDIDMNTYLLSLELEI
jgi:hypothetical protein